MSRPEMVIQPRTCVRIVIQWYVVYHVETIPTDIAERKEPTPRFSSPKKVTPRPPHSAPASPRYPPPRKCAWEPSTSEEETCWDP